MTDQPDAKETDDGSITLDIHDITQTQDTENE